MRLRLNSKSLTCAICLDLALFVAGLHGQTEMGNSNPNGSGTNLKAFNYAFTAPWFEGYKLSPEEVTELENTVEINPENLEARSRLLSYYYTHSARDKTLRPKQERIVLWLIQNHPDSKILGDLHGKLIPRINNYAVGETLWNSQLQKYPDNLKVISNACGYFQVGNIDLAIRCYKYGKSIDPENASEWDRKLGTSYNAKMVNSPADQQSLWAQEALSAFENAYAESKPKTYSYNAGGSDRTFAFPDILKSSLLPLMAKAALAADDLDKAVKYANQMLETAGERENSLQKGDYIYTGNSILGLVSVQKGDLESADEYLLNAGETPGSAGLTIGPDMSLAKVLLSRGHRDTVLAFLKKIQKFSDSNLSHVGQWIQEMEEGKIPDFDQMRHELEQQIQEIL
jgi:tetratricopeptide (TPR) repeat protein